MYKRGTTFLVCKVLATLLRKVIMFCLFIVVTLNTKRLQAIRNNVQYNHLKNYNW